MSGLRRVQEQGFVVCYSEPGGVASGRSWMQIGKLTRCRDGNPGGTAERVRARPGAFVLLQGHADQCGGMESRELLALHFEGLLSLYASATLTAGATARGVGPFCFRSTVMIHSLCGLVPIHCSATGQTLPVEASGQSEERRIKARVRDPVIYRVKLSMTCAFFRHKK
ncbi:hypothetical protein BX600DRAFT_123086 [Xylariales sp. PMI_506]|nr:hypothetical protein BX600DRAFT_123086 [Xylariales sp. PMI_506]